MKLINQRRQESTLQLFKKFRDDLKKHKLIIENITPTTNPTSIQPLSVESLLKFLLSELNNPRIENITATINDASIQPLYVATPQSLFNSPADIQGELDMRKSCGDAQAQKAWDTRYGLVVR